VKGVVLVYFFDPLLIRTLFAAAFFFSHCF
jgi:hypothetical protein